MLLFVLVILGFELLAAKIEMNSVCTGMSKIIEVNEIKSSQYAQMTNAETENVQGKTFIFGFKVVIKKFEESI